MCYESYIKLPSLPLHLAISISLAACLPFWSLPPLSYPLQISFILLEVVRKNEREREREEYKTTFSSPKQEHLLIVEVTVSVQPHALNTTLLVLMMHRAEGEGGKERERERETNREEDISVGGGWDGRIELFFSTDSVHPHPLSYLPSPSSTQEMHLSFHIHPERFF